MRDETKNRILTPAVKNLIARKKGPALHDISEFVLPEDKFFWITGAGYTLYHWVDIEPQGFIIANQSTADTLIEYGIRPDLIVLADPQDCIGDWLEGFEREWGNTIPVISSTMTNVLPAPNHYFYKPFLQASDEYSNLFNTVVQECTPKIKTFILQAGNVTNAALLVILELARRQNYENLKIGFAGVDCEFIYSYTRGPKFTEANGWDEPPVYTDGPSIVKFGGRVSTYPLLNYRKQLAEIVQSFDGMEGPNVPKFCVYVPEEWNETSFIHLLEDFMGRY